MLWQGGARSSMGGKSSLCNWICGNEFWNIRFHRALTFPHLLMARWRRRRQGTITLSFAHSLNSFFGSLGDIEIITGTIGGLTGCTLDELATTCLSFSLVGLPAHQYSLY
ncbi:hypothetical protein Salat_1999500 [Sesamum alatum]|uniref:Uncharacterized protein n=1 Tax=Sesamum alatum TaxID=300844 RepID=A0AAE1XYK1_9LAMI|nr:hypothetical protein Salat_1999500 [Sesamum alatum]